MKQSKLRITAVSYTNTVPFIYGLTRFPDLSEKIELTLLPPALCAEAWESGAADIALVPVGAMQESDLDRMCCQWCIGAERAVESVLLLSDEPIGHLKTLYLDTESRTSVLMTSILCKHLWHITPELKPLRMHDGFRPGPGKGMVLIGDKTFGLADSYPHVTDLATAWQQLTGLPAVFACWLTREDVSPEMRGEINEALSWGVSHIREAVQASAQIRLPEEEAVRYLTECISFTLGIRQQEAVKTFFALRRSL